MADLNTDVRYIKGIGEQRAKALGKLGIATLRDLISYFPRAYDDRSALRRIADLVPGETAGVAAMVASPPTISHIRKGLDLVKLRAVDDTGTLDVTFFNQAWLKNSLHQGETYIFYGRAEGSLLRHQMANPVVEPEGRREVTGRIVPIYPLTAGVSQLILSRSIRQGLDACADILPDVLPDRVRQHHQLCRIEYAYENIHFPESAEALDLARRRLAFEELFLFTIGLERLRSRREVVHVPPCGGVDMELFYRALPFTLTDAQRRCVEEALADMRSGTPMNRLCQGDVGSGKKFILKCCQVSVVCFLYKKTFPEHTNFRGTKTSAFEMRPIQGGIEMNELSELDLQNLRHLIGGFDTTHCKMTAYAQEAGDPAVKQFFQKSAQSAMQCKQQLMTFLQ